ncbi:MBOAT family O-acyltransferase [Kiloniella spongiae]|uniref:MBOAT family O-acyltransferase n=1 Tax=Kiloniella spongiae TaxID=1489064 RepID=UPI0006995EE6|nr:MBOAT family O-acyltransferase [Kiloniella spongiae]
MSFSSLNFVLLFLPILSISLFFINIFNIKLLTTLLLPITVSFIFYSLSGVQNLILLGASIFLNIALAKAQILLIDKSSKKIYRKIVLSASLTLNLGILAYFKYSLLNVNPLTISRDFNTFEEMILPLGISFYTFQQIAFQIDCYWAKVKELSVENYVLFVSFFPQLVAGPIMHHSEMMPQFAYIKKYGLSFTSFRAALALFSIGLFKKVVIADKVGASVDSVYTPLAQGHDIPLLDAWAAAIGFPLQIYFDFSGYSDMACALALLFGIKLTLNFNSPFKSLSLIEFWSTWHITLMRFFRDYVFTPLSYRLTKYSIKQNYNTIASFLITLALPVIIAFLLTGLWHGSGTTFLIFGGIHGLAISLNHAWRYFKLPSINKGVSWFLTMLFVCISFIFLRVPETDSLIKMLHSLHSGALYLPSQFEPLLSKVDTINLVFGAGTFAFFEHGIMMFTTMLIVIIICLTLPNSNQLMKNEKTILNYHELPNSYLQFNYSKRWGFLIGLSLAISLIAMSFNTADFIYYQF